ncbi:MAG: hypothetical protein WC088_05800 [Candidatus Izemoplasmatales bacterium]
MPMVMLGQLGDIQSTNMYAYCANNPIMYTDSDGYFPEQIDYLTIMIPSRRLNCFFDIDTSTWRTSSIYYPENRDDYAKVWSIILAIIYANYMISFYTSAGGLVAFGVSTLTSVIVGVVFWAITVVTVAVIIYVIIDAIATILENNEEE